MADLLTQTLENKEDLLSRTLSEKKDPLKEYDQIKGTLDLVDEYNGLKIPDAKFAYDKFVDESNFVKPPPKTKIEQMKPYDIVFAPGAPAAFFFAGDDYKELQEPSDQYITGLLKGFTTQTQIPALAGQKFKSPESKAESFGFMTGQITEEIIELITAAKVVKELGLATGTVQKAVQTANIFGLQTATQEIRKGIAEHLYDEDFNYEGGTEVLESTVIGALLSIAESGVGAVWGKLKPSERARALKILGLKKSATVDEINVAAKKMAQKYNFNLGRSGIGKKAGQKLDLKFKNIMNARDTLKKSIQENIIIKGKKPIKELAKTVNALTGEVLPATDAQKYVKDAFTPGSIDKRSNWIVEQMQSGKTVDMTKAPPLLPITKPENVAKLPVKTTITAPQTPVEPQTQAEPTVTAPETKAQGEVTLVNYDEVVEPINQAMDELETKLKEQGLSPEQILEHPEMEALGQQRDKIDQQAIKQYSDIVHKAFEDAGITDNKLTFNPMVGIASDIYYAPESDAVAKFTPINTMYEVGQRAIDNETETLKKLAEKIFKYQAEVEGLDPEGILSPLSGLSKSEQKARLMEAARIAEKIHNSIKSQLGQAQTEPKQLSQPTPPVKESLTTEKPIKESKQTEGFLTIPTEIPSPEILREGAEKIYQNLINRFASIENTTKKAQSLGMTINPGENPALRARSYLGLGRKVETILKDKTFRTNKQGNTEITGEGFKPILDDFDKTLKTFESNRDIREKEFHDYLFSQRTIQDLQRPVYEGGENIATEKQVADAKVILEKLQKKYGEAGIAKFKDISKRLYDFQKRVLHLLVDGGNLSQQQYDEIIRKNSHYIPFDRILENEMFGGVPVSKNRFTAAKAPIQKIKGSELEKQNPFESIIKNTYRIIEASERNTVARSVAKIGKVLPDEISPVRVKMVPIRIDPTEILTVAKEFRSKSANVVEEIKDIKIKSGENADVSGPVAKLEKVVKDALTHRGFSEGESNAFVSQIKKGQTSTVGESIHTIETIKQIIKETERIIISEEPVESTIFRPSQFKPKGNVIEYYDNGKKKYIEVTPNLYQAMTGLNETSASLAVRILSAPAHWLRVGATITPEFILRNPIRDQYTAYMQTSFGFIPFVDSLGAIADIVGKTEVYHEWLASGGAYSGFVELNRPALKKAYKELTMQKSLLSNLNIIEKAEDLSQLMEQATRLGVFKKAKKSGLSDIEAGFESREATTDFGRRGAATTDINRVVAFFNASMQGFDKSVRNAIKNPYNTAIKGFTAITIPSLLLYLINRKDPEYKEIPRWQRDLFWIVKIGGIHWRFPKPFLYGQIFGSLPERLIEYVDTKNPEAFNGLAKSMYDSVSPVSGTPESGLLPTAIKPLIENSVNWNFFMERPIVPESKQDLIPSEQYGRYTTETSKQLGEWFNYSPAKIENLTRGYFGGSGGYALEGTDMLINSIKRASGQKVEPKRPKELADIPLVKGFVTRPTGANAQSIQDFYDESNEIIELSNTYSKMIREKRKEDARQLKLDNPQIKIASTLKDYRTKLSDYQKKIDLIIKSDMSEDKKREEITKLDKQRLDIAIKGRLKIKANK